MQVLSGFILPSLRNFTEVQNVSVILFCKVSSNPKHIHYVRIIPSAQDLPYFSFSPYLFILARGACEDVFLHGKF